MTLKSELDSKLTSYPKEFWIDEHALKRCGEYYDLEIRDVLRLLKSRKYQKVNKNDSKQQELKHYDSYRIYIDKSNKYKYEIILYLTEGKLLIKTVSKLNRTAQERLQ